MKIVVFDMDNPRSPQWGSGQAYVTQEIFRRLGKKHEVKVYCSKYPGYSDYSFDGISYVHVGLGTRYPIINNLGFLVTLPFIAMRLKTDVIIENFTAPFAVCFTPLFTRIPVVGVPSFFSTADLSKKYHINFDAITRFGLRFYKYALPFTGAQEKRIKESNFKIKTQVVPNGIDEHYLLLKTQEKNFILFFGRLDINHKGLDLLLEAFSMIVPNITEDLYIMGSGTKQAEDALLYLTKKYGVEKRVKLLGKLSGVEKDRYIADAKFVVSPSRFETQSIAALESLASGKPLVCFDIEGFQWLKDKEVCLKARTFLVDDFANKMLELSANTIMRSEMGSRARAFAQHFNWENTSLQYENFLQVVINDNGAV